MEFLKTVENVGEGGERLPQIMLHNYHTVDGSEIRRSAVEGQVVYASLYTGFYTSQVVQEFLDQQ